MAPIGYHISIFLIASILLLSPPAESGDDPEDQLFDGINKYRASLNLSALSKNKNAECLADKIADQFKGQDCTNSTGANTVPGTETQFPNYPQLLAECHLNITNTRDGMVMPSCVPHLEKSLVLTNFTQSQYSQYLNSSTYTGAGIASEDDWIVVVLSTPSSAGDFAPATNGVNLPPKVSFLGYLLPFLVGFTMILMS